MSILIIILILSLLVIIHELGHFFAARWAGIKVIEFGLGYPPRAARLFKRHGTIFSLNWIPFGGFVQMHGEEGADEKTVRNSKGAFYAQSGLKRLIVILAGATVNFLFGVVAFAIVFSISGIPTPLNEARIATVVKDSPAETAGLPANVTIQAIKVGEDLIQTASSNDVITVVEQNRGKTVTIVTTGLCTELSCEAVTQEFPTYIRLAEETPEGQGSLGIVFQPVLFLHYPWYEMPFRAVWYGLIQALWLGMIIVQSLGDILVQLFTKGVVPEGVAGPVGIIHQTQASGLFNDGLLAILGFAGMLSVNLAIINVMPIPALDGGRALFIFIQKITGQKRIEKIERIAHYVGFIFLLSLVLLVTIRDVMRIFS